MIQCPMNVFFKVSSNVLEQFAVLISQFAILIEGKCLLKYLVYAPQVSHSGRSALLYRRGVHSYNIYFTSQIFSAHPSQVSTV